MSLSVCSGGVLIHLAALNKRDPPSSQRMVVLQEANKKEKGKRSEEPTPQGKRRHMPQEDTTDIKYLDEISERVVVPSVVLQGSTILKPFPGLSIKQTNKQTQKQVNSCLIQKAHSLSYTKNNCIREDS